ncbi:MAG: NEW3 domain-containing protein, partial [Halobacteriales archaeon]|nr:NEW3 domain-containing protein [Halobacteriales archaeon]
RLLSFIVRYRNPDGEIRRSTPVDAPVRVGKEVDRFTVEPGRTTVEAGSHRTVSLQVTNTGTDPITDVEAKLFADDPLSSANDEAFVSRLEPGETTTLTFDLGATAGIIAKDYPVAVDFSYEDAAGDRELSDTHRVPITVTEPTKRERPWPLLGGVGLAAVGAVLGLIARRRGLFERFH